MNRDAYANAYQMGRTKTVNFLMSKGFVEQQASETAQEAWARGWERRHQLRKPQKVVQWVNTIAYNMARAWCHRESSMQGLDDTAPIEAHRQPISPSIDAERVLNLCPEKDRRLLERRYLEDWDISDLAENQNCSNTAIRVRLHRARNVLRNKIQAGGTIRREPQAVMQSDNSIHWSPLRELT